MKIILALWALAELAGCADAHLGDYYGRRTRAAFDAQTQATGGESAGTMDADDAKITLARQRGRSLPGSLGAAQMAPTSAAYGLAGGAVLGGTATGGIQSSSPPAGGIRLDAVR